MTFDDYHLAPKILDALRERQFLAPTPVQDKVIPLILEGKDVIALAETGSGKTAACAIPICHKIVVEDFPIQALVLVPTRELALQYAEEAQKIGRLQGVKAFALFGGEDMSIQRAKLKSGVHILVATPGRLIDFIYARGIDLTHVRMLAIDEADEMLSIGFLEDLEFIMNCLVQKHQTLLFSATMPEAIRILARKYMHAPSEITLISERLSPEKLEHRFFLSATEQGRIKDLIYLLKKLNPVQTLIFVDSRRETEKIYRDLKHHFQGVDFLHGGLDQNIRISVTTKFTRGKIHTLVATDVASRGLDFSKVTHVINFRLPQDNEIYLHRAGRTARIGREGMSLTLVTRRDITHVKQLMSSLTQEPQWLE